VASILCGASLFRGWSIQIFFLQPPHLLWLTRSLINIRSMLLSSL
jgi:hypothetical protein